MTQQRWHVCPPVPSDLSSQLSGFDPLLVQLLYNRGITEPAGFEPFIAGDERLANDPLLLPDIDKAVARINRALLGGELIAVFGDFDADGITAAAVLVQGIGQLGGNVISYIPHRLNEGHGLNDSALEHLRLEGASLVVTVDCGITGASEVKRGRELGLDIVITDHHVPSDTIPDAVAVVDPKLPESEFPFSELAGVGVAVKLLQALFRAANRGAEADEFLDLVALGTVADMVPLTGENRYLVKRGLEVLNQSRRVGLQELVLSSRLEMGKLDAQDISFSLGPRLNASGRLGHGVTSYELLMTSSREKARELAAMLEAGNTERRRLTSEAFENAREKLAGEAGELPLLIVGDSGYQPGVVGVVAGRLVDEFYRPAIVIHLDEGTARGSARSIPDFDIIAALTECRDLLTRFGGHSQAAGFIMPDSDVDKLRERLQKIAARELADVDLRPALSVDTVVPLSALRGQTYKMIGRLEPYGQANQIPCFLSKKVQVVSSRAVGANGDHLKLKVRDGNVVWDAIAFDLGHRELASHLDIVYNLETETWTGRELLRLNIRDFSPASSTP
ncbi:MAG: single-stranded-DNA-specific exonuclease RecJ [Dehalococcoidia bacterium]